MNYNFDIHNNRRGTNSMKWDGRTDLPGDVIPLWVADMDFRTAEPIIDALRRRVDRGIFGYTHVPDAYYRAVTDWFDRYHSWHIDRQEVIYTSGVVPAISAIIKALAKPGDKVLVQTPVYNCFFSSIRNNGCTALESPLVLDGDRYRMDFDDLEAKAAMPDCTLMLLCNPHNPAGRVWTRAELTRVADICRRHSVVVVSDEIHCELVYAPHQYTPFALAAQGSGWVSCVSPTKAFNIAGLQIANIVAPDDDMRLRIDKAININEVCDVNPFGVDALMAAYNQSRDWLEQLLPYLHDNYLMLRDRFARDLPSLKVIDLEGTYLAWIDCRSIIEDSELFEEDLIRRAGVWLNAGRIYGEAGEGFMRVNLACPRSLLAEALDRMVPVLADMVRAKG